MNIVNRIDRYLNDREYKIIIENNKIDIINYDEIVDFSLSRIVVRYDKKMFIIDGLDLAISRMLDNEVLITGNIYNLSIK